MNQVYSKPVMSILSGARRTISILPCVTHSLRRGESKAAVLAVRPLRMLRLRAPTSLRYGDRCAALRSGVPQILPLLKTHPMEPREVANTSPCDKIGADYRLICARCLFRGNRTKRLLSDLGEVHPDSWLVSEEDTSWKQHEPVSVLGAVLCRFCIVVAGLILLALLAGGCVVPQTPSAAAPPRPPRLRRPFASRPHPPRFNRRPHRPRRSPPRRSRPAQKPSTPPHHPLSRPLRRPPRCPPCLP